jgi:hypothetical protein
MTRREAEGLKLGDRVRYVPGEGGDPAEACGGKVGDKGYNAVRIDWDDGKYGTVYFDGSGLPLAQVEREAAAQAPAGKAARP